MNAFHVMIATERRKAPRELALVMSADVYDADGKLVQANPPQLHTMGTTIADINDPQIIYAASWDQVSPWIVLLKGDRSTLKMGYMGWPTVTQAEWMAANPVVTP